MTILSDPFVKRLLMGIFVPIAVHIIAVGFRRIVDLFISRLKQNSKKEQDIFVAYPRAASVLTILSGTAIFCFYFFGIGYVLLEFNINLKAYFASASIVGLAVAFGSQSLVQDFISGLTLIFTNVLSCGDVVEISGQIGQIERIGLRYTTLSNFSRQKIYIPNRNISIISRFLRGASRVYIDLDQIPLNKRDVIMNKLASHLATFHRRYKNIIFVTPTLKVIEENGSSELIRIKFNVYPGQFSSIEPMIKKQIQKTVQEHAPDWEDWLLTTTLRGNL